MKHNLKNIQTSDNVWIHIKNMKTELQQTPYNKLVSYPEVRDDNEEYRRGFADGMHALITVISGEEAS